MLDHLKVLILNSDCRPLSVWPLSFTTPQEAIKTVFRGRATVVEEYDHILRSANTEMRVPKVILLNHYAPIQATPKFCRRSVLLRDRYTCQYCGEKFPGSELTYDHLIPRSKGGQTTWENILCACSVCNSEKKDSMPNFSGKKGKKGSGHRPLKMPKQPSTAELLRAGLEHLDPKIREDFADWIGWERPIGPVDSQPGQIDPQ